jgi:hypothetical protein
MLGTLEWRAPPWLVKMQPYADKQGGLMSANNMPRVISLLALLAGFAAAPAAALQILTEEYPPYNFTEKRR